MVVAAAAGTTAVLAGGDSWNPALPACARVAAALPGHPALAEQFRTDGTETTAGIRPLHIRSVQCDGGGTRVSIDIFDRGEYDPRTMNQYSDKTVHEGPSRAKTLFDEQARGLTAASPTVAYGSLDYAGGDCTTIEVKKNVLVSVTVMGTGTTPDERTANCREDGAKQMAAVIGAIG